MVWYNLRVGSYFLKYTPLKPKEIKYPYCDSEGNLLNFVKGKFESGYFEDEKGNRAENIFFLINNKPYAKISKTKETDTYKEVNKNEVDDLIIEKTYIVECEKLYNDLEATEKSLKFGISFGGDGKFGSVKTYYAYIHTSDLYKGFLFMSVGTTKKSEAMIEITEQLKQKEKLEQLNLVVSGIDKAKVEDLIQLWKLKFFQIKKEAKW